MSSERLSTLLRQRKLLSDHLAWLDAEIASANASPSPEAATPAPLVAPPPVPAASRPLPEGVGIVKEADPEAIARANALADSLLKQYSESNPDTPASARRSCLLLSVAVGLFGVAILMGIYLIFYSGDDQAKPAKAPSPPVERSPAR